MNWDAIGAIGELIGALAVVVTLGFLALQVRRSTRATNESNRLERASAIDRHADSVSRWRGRLMENEALARIWLAATKDQELNEEDQFRLLNLWIDFANIQRSNYVRAHVVGEIGVARQAIISVAAQCVQSDTFKKLWERMRPWHEMGSPEFVNGVDSEIVALGKDETSPFHPSVAFGLTRN